MTYKNKKVIALNVQLTKGHYINLTNVYLCFPLKFKSAADNDNSRATGLITVDNFFVHWIKELISKDTAMTYLFYR